MELWKHTFPSLCTIYPRRLKSTECTSLETRPKHADYVLWIEVFEENSAKLYFFYVVQSLVKMKKKNAESLEKFIKMIRQNATEGDEMQN